MVDICWSEKGGWHRPRVQPYGPISLDPAAAVLHYGQEIFEGLKAYRHPDGSIGRSAPTRRLRLQRSARRMALPELPSEHFIESLRKLIAVDADWVPTEPDTCLYFRPFMFAKEAFWVYGRPKRWPTTSLAARWVPTSTAASSRYPSGCRALRARCRRRHGCCQDWRQLRRQPHRSERGLRKRLPASAVPTEP